MDHGAHQIVGKAAGPRALSPDIDRAIGGVKQLYRHVEHLVALGWDAAVVTEGEGFRPSWFSSSAPTISLQASVNSGELTTEATILVLPETYLGVDLASFRGLNLSKLSRVVFNQNAYYSFGDFASARLKLLSIFMMTILSFRFLAFQRIPHFYLQSWHSRWPY